MRRPAPLPRLTVARPATGSAMAPLALLLGLLGAIAVTEPGFVSPDNLVVLAAEASVILLLATGQTLVILIGGIDLSMAALAALASVLIALALPAAGGAGVLAVLALCTLIGALQGALHARAQLPSVLVTLAGMGMWQGLALAIAHSTIMVEAGYDAIGWLEASSLGLPHSFAFAAAVLALLAGVMRWTPFGRRSYAVGHSATVAMFSGIRVWQIRTAAFALSGLCSGLAGMALVARTASGNPGIADSLLLPSIAAVLIGGTAMRGGVGGLGRTLIGALSVTVLRIGIAAAGVDPAWEPIAYGVLVVAAVTLTARPRDLS
jgi:ribose transport system permease protein